MIIIIRIIIIREPVPLPAVDGHVHNVWVEDGFQAH